MSVKDELQQYISWVEWETQKSLRKIQRALVRSGLNFDKEFVHRFIRFTTNRICDAYDNIEIDATIHVRNNDEQKRKKRGYTGSDDEMEMHKKVRLESPLNGSYSGHLIGATRSLNEIHGEENQKTVEQKRMASELETSLSNTLLKNSTENVHGIIKQDGYNDDERTSNANGNELFDESITNNLLQCKNQIKREHDQNRSIDSGINSNGTSTFDCVGSPKLPHALKFTCFYCSSEASTNFECYDRIEAVHAHWTKSHWSQDDEAFKFCIVERVNCYYCGVRGSHQEVVEHQKKEHANERTVVAAGNKRTCALCPYEGLKLLEHFAAEHEQLLKSNYSITFYLTDTMLNWLLKINTRRIVGKMLKIESNMDEYDRMFEQHESTSRLMIYDQIEFAVCGCKSKINPIDYLNHIESHRHDFHCSKCSFKANDLIELVGHDKDQHQINSLNYRCLELEDRLQKNYMNTKLIFRNGLVIAMRHLMNTKFDIFAKVTEFIDKLLIAQMEQYNRMNFGESSFSTNDACHDMHGKPSDSKCALKFQAELTYGIFIAGIPWTKNENLQSYVFKLCKFMDIDVSNKDLESVTRPPDSKKPFMIARFRSQSIRDKIMERKSKTKLWSSVFVTTSLRPIEVKIDWMVKRGFEALNRLARQSAQKQQLHTYRWDERGLFVQHTNKSKGKYVRNEDELRDYIK